MCDASSGEKKIAGKINSFSDTLVSQAKTVFGAANSIFNEMHNAYQKIVNAGPSQHGMSQDEFNTRNAEVINQNADAYRNAKTATGNAVAGIGGGNTVMPSGTIAQTEADIATAAAANTSNSLADVRNQDYALGRDNYWKAASGEENLPSVFSTAASFDGQAQEGLQSSLKEQQSLDAQSGWWKAPVMGLVSGAASLATGGLSSLASGGSFMGGVSTALGNQSKTLAGQ